MDIDEFLDKVSEEELSSASDEATILGEKGIHESIEKIRSMLNQNDISKLPAAYTKIKDDFFSLTDKHIETKKKIHKKLLEFNDELKKKLRKLELDINKKAESVEALIKLCYKALEEKRFNKADAIYEKINSLISEVPEIFIEKKAILEMKAVILYKAMLYKIFEKTRQEYISLKKKMLSMLMLADKYVSAGKVGYATKILYSLNELYNRFPNGYMLEKIEIYDKILGLQRKIDDKLLNIGPEIEETLQREAGFAIPNVIPDGLSSPDSRQKAEKGGNEGLSASMSVSVSKAAYAANSSTRSRQAELDGYKSSKKKHKVPGFDTYVKMKKQAETMQQPIASAADEESVFNDVIMPLDENNNVKEQERQNSKKSFSSFLDLGKHGGEPESLSAGLKGRDPKDNIKANINPCSDAAKSSGTNTKNVYAIGGNEIETDLTGLKKEFNGLIEKKQEMPKKRGFFSFLFRRKKGEQDASNNKLDSSSKQDTSNKDMAKQKDLANQKDNLANQKDVDKKQGTGNKFGKGGRIRL